ncbi:MAG: hypothetical protein JXQ27_03720 [Acidobacteria bacterium]|nr:hypothetical protein [Acidobacteriota bacterium]
MPRGRVRDFLHRLDLELGALDEKAVESLFDTFARKAQPRVMELLRAIAEQNRIAEEFLAESLFHLYSVQRFYEETEQVPPPRFGRRRLLAGLDDVERIIDGLSPEVDLMSDPLTAAEIPFFADDIPRLFFHRWRAELQDMLDFGEVSEDLYWDLLRFYLVVLRLYHDEFSDF